MTIDWGGLLIGQLDFYWRMHLRPRLAGLTDEEYLWEPVAGCWTVRPGPDGVHGLDGHWPEPAPPPVTTIAWRMMHIAVGCLWTKASAFFGDGSVPDDADMFDPRHEPADLPATADEAVAFLERAYGRWHDGIAGLDEGGLTAPLGAKGAVYAGDPMVELMVHVNREIIHHGGEIGVLRDLYRATGATTRRSTLVPVEAASLRR
ncbi:MAG TPA: DinB family protein [Micromonosporaceae bacterium]|jgi:hypothetical protein